MLFCMVLALPSFVRRIAPVHMPRLVAPSNAGTTAPGRATPWFE